MTTENIGLFKAIGAKMDYLNQRQRVLSQNVANADTPSYVPQDLKEVDFSRVLENVADPNPNRVKIDSTKPNHMPSNTKIDDPRSVKNRDTYEVAPAGNAVIMEEQLIQANETVMDYNLMSNIYQKQVGMLYTALGRGR